jgi:chemotaxis protein CheX
MKFAETELRQITEETWRIVLEEELELASQPATPEKIEDSIGACAQIAGDWQLAVVLNCSRAAARYAATAMFATTQADEKPEDIQDTMCELINIIAGNIKGVLSGISHLSLPYLVKDQDFKLMFPRHMLLSEVHFTYRGELLCVALLGEDKLSARFQDREFKPFI